jgi:phosphatidate cytidylyltransferase
LLLSLPNFINPAKYEIVLALFIMIWCNDTFAYLVGKSIGKHKLLESVSPKKTIEGFIGGIVFTLVASVIISRFYTFFNVTLWIVSALIISVFGTLGDLVESKFKREASIKDSGNIMPGHGGILDRLDSVIFVIPFLYLLYLIYFYYA